MFSLIFNEIIFNDLDIVLDFVHDSVRHFEKVLIPGCQKSIVQILGH